MKPQTYLSLIALAGTIAGVGVSSAHAQSAPAPADQGAPPSATHPHRRGPMMEALRGLNLSSDQQAQIKAARQRFKASKNSATPETGKQLRSDIESSLTPDQRSQFEDKMRAYRQTRSGQPAQGAPAPSHT